jgi:hypothetical protein
VHSFIEGGVFIWERVCMCVCLSAQKGGERRECERINKREGGGAWAKKKKEARVSSSPRSRNKQVG